MASHASFPPPTIAHAAAERIRDDPDSNRVADRPSDDLQERGLLRARGFANVAKRGRWRRARGAVNR